MAAGIGSRLKPLTNNLPKCLVEVGGIPIIYRLITNLRNVGLINHLIVAGHKSKLLEEFHFNIIQNRHYKKTNMVWSLTCTLDRIENSNSEFINIFYGDIVISTVNIERFLNSKNDFSIMVDLCWEKLWSLRMDDYFSDIESLKYENNCITELGKIPKSKDDIQGQYIGALRIKRLKLIKLLVDYKKAISKSNDFNLVHSLKNLYMTEFIQNYIDDGGSVKPFFIKGGWLEIDSMSDIQAYESPEGKFSLDSVS